MNEWKELQYFTSINKLCEIKDSSLIVFAPRLLLLGCKQVNQENRDIYKTKTNTSQNKKELPQFSYSVDMFYINYI